MTESARPRLIRAAFDRAADTYDSAAQVQGEISEDLLALATAHPPRATRCFVDAGCGTGRGAARVREWLAPESAIAIDFAPAMLMKPCHENSLRVCADLHALPLGNACVDALWSSLAMQWCDPGVVLKEVARVLTPGAHAWIATLGPRTLHELKAAFRAVDDARHVIEFFPRSDWLATAQQAGLALLEARGVERAALAPDLRTLLHDIKAIGAHSVGSGRRTTPLGKSAWRTLTSRYEAHRRRDGLLPATYDVILLALRKPE